MTAINNTRAIKTLVVNTGWGSTRSAGSFIIEVSSSRRLLLVTRDDVGQVWCEPGNVVTRVTDQAAKLGIKIGHPDLKPLSVFDDPQLWCLPRKK